MVAVAVAGLKLKNNLYFIIIILIPQVQKESVANEINISSKPILGQKKESQLPGTALTCSSLESSLFYHPFIINLG